MKLISYAQSFFQVDQLLKNGIDEIIISCKELSRFQESTFDELIVLLNYINKQGANAILECDVLYPENVITNAIKIFEKLPMHDFKAIRIQDPGILYYIKNNYSWMPIQLILETGNHNLEGLLKWEAYIGNQLQRVILSNELAREQLEQYTGLLKTPIEILVFGRILLFYGPRKLLSPIFKVEDPTQTISALGTSEESPHSGFPIIENSHGTFMFNVKDLSLMDQLAEIEKIKISWGRVDLRFDDSFSQLESIKEYKGPRPLIKGFFHINKSDVLFSKLKNKKTNRMDTGFLGVVVDVEKEKGMAILIKSKLITVENIKIIKIITPEGKEKKLDKFFPRNSKSQAVNELEDGQIIICPYLQGVTVKSQVYWS